MSENTKGLFPFYYVFAAKGLQSFIMQGDKLVLMVEGSALIENLAGAEGFFGNLLSEMGLSEGEDYQVLSRAAGGIRLLLRERSMAEDLTRLVPGALGVSAPGLEFVQTFVEVLPEGLAKTIEHAEEILANRRNLLFPSYPVAGPLVDRCPRSGLPAVGYRKFGSDKEPADEAMMAKKRVFEKVEDLLRAKILSEKEQEGLPRFELPSDFSDLSRRGERENIGIVHIDGNGLGLLVKNFLQRLQNEKRDDAFVAQAYSEFSQAIQNAANRAFQSAAAPLIEEDRKRNSRGKKELYSFRPLICAGDDVTAVLRGADAFSFASDFLEAFEMESRKALESVGGGGFFLGEDGKPRGLTACGGIVFVKKNFPFAQAYDLCESLCSFAKKKTDRKCSALAFWRVTTTAAEEFEPILKRELTFPDDFEENTSLVATMMPYGVNIPEELKDSVCSVEDLVTLKYALKAMPRGSSRQLLSEMARGKTRTERNFNRLKDVSSGRKDGKGSSEAFRALEEALKKLTGSKENSSESVLFRSVKKPEKGSEKQEFVTPLHDAMELLSAERG